MYINGGTLHRSCGGVGAIADQEDAGVGKNGRTFSTGRALLSRFKKIPGRTLIVGKEYGKLDEGRAYEGGMLL